MDARNLPYGAADIIAVRKAGKCPADMVLVSLVGALPAEDNPVVVARLGYRYDWRFLTGLECLVVADSKQAPQVVRELMGQLKSLSAAYLGIWFADLQQGINFIVGGVTAQPRGLLSHMTVEDRQNFAGIGQRQGCMQCA